MQSSKIKEIYNSIKLYICIDKNILDLFSNYLNLGLIKKVISCDERSYDFCNEHVSSEYYSKENLVKEIRVITSDNRIYLIKEEFLGLNFEEESDDYILTIFDEDLNIVGETQDLANYLELKKSKKKRKKFIKMLIYRKYISVFSCIN